MNTIPRAVAGSSVPTTFLAKTASSYSSSGSGPFGQRQEQHQQFGPHAPFQVAAAPQAPGDHIIAPAGASGVGVGVGVGVVTGVAPLVTGGAPPAPVPGAGAQAIRSGMSVEDLKRLTAQRQQAQAALMSGQLQAAQHAHMHAHAHGHSRMHGHAHGAHHHHHHRHRHHHHHHRHRHGHRHGHHVVQHGFHSFVPAPAAGQLPPHHATAQPFAQAAPLPHPPTTAPGAGGAAPAGFAEPWAFGAGSAVPFGVSAFGAAPHSTADNSGTGSGGGNGSSSASPWAPQTQQRSEMPKDDAASAGQQVSTPQKSAGAGGGVGTVLWARGTWGPVVAPTPTPDKPLAFAALPGLSLSARLGDTASPAAFGEHAVVDEMERPGSACAVSDPDEDLMRVMEETGLSTVLDFDMGDARSVASVDSVGMGPAIERPQPQAARLPLNSTSNEQALVPVDLLASADGGAWSCGTQQPAQSLSLFDGFVWRP